jgi:atypical dual specificity phosphatase
MSEITDKIWIGSYGDASNEIFLSERRITHVITCAHEFSSSILRPGYKIPIIDDTVNEKTMEYFLEGAAKINEWVNEGKCMIVHCFAGMSRSVSVVITYLIVYKGWSFQIALDHLKLRRRQTNPHPGFIPILKLIEARRAQTASSALLPPGDTGATAE